MAKKRFIKLSAHGCMDQPDIAAKIFKTMDKFIWRDKTWAEFSTLDVAVPPSTMQLRSKLKRPNLKLKTRPKQLLGYLPLAFALTEETLSSTIWRSFLSSRP